ncbi:hypothetical protein ACFSNO_07285, partial [Streptomyces cirratus]
MRARGRGHGFPPDFSRPAVVPRWHDPGTAHDDVDGARDEAFRGVPPLAVPGQRRDGRTGTVRQLLDGGGGSRRASADGFWRVVAGGQAGG